MGYEVGDTITYVAFGGEERTVIVTEKYEDVKNGLPGFDAVFPDYDPATDSGVWGYDNQIIRVDKKA